MQVSKPIYWHEGLFLRPQHLQQQDLHFKNYALELLRISVANSWGIKYVSMVQSALNNQIVEINNCEIIFQDGTHIKSSENACIQRRNISNNWDKSGKPMSIYLGLKKLQVGKNNLDTVPDDQGTAPAERSELYTSRYQTPETPTYTYDLFSDDKKNEVFYLEHKLQIFIDDEKNEAVDFHLIKVAELQRIGTEIKISKKYIPPVLFINSSPVLSALFREIKEQTASRANELALYKQDKVLANLEFGSRDMIYFLALLTLNRFAPYTDQLHEAQFTNPQQLYTVLCQMAGELSTFTTGNNITDYGNNGSNVPIFDHENLIFCFTRVIKIIIKMMDELTAGPDYSKELMFDGTYYYSDISECTFQGKNEYYLRVSYNNSLEGKEINSIIDYVQNRAKISCREQLPILIAHSLPGIIVQYDVSPSTKLPRSANKLYFKIDHHNERWNSVRESLNMAVYFDKPVKDLKIDLMMVNG